MGLDRVTIQEAASRLGIKEGAVRKRIERGTLQKEHGEDGRVYVFIKAPSVEGNDTETTWYDTGHDKGYPAGYDKLIQSQQEQVEYLRSVVEQRDRELEARTEEIRRRDHIIAALTERIPELEAPPASAQEATQDRQATTEQGTSDHSEEEQMTVDQNDPEEVHRHEKSPWWRRIFGG